MTKSMKTEPMKIELVVGAINHIKSKVLLDGVDISHHVRAVTFSAGIDELTVARLDLTNVEVSVDGEAFIDGVVIPVVADNGAEDVTAFEDEARMFKSIPKPPDGDAA